MLIPLGHEQMSARRWPVVTFALIALNVIVFLGTNWTIEDQAAQLGETKVHLLMLAAMHPELNVSGEAQQFVQRFEQSRPDLWKELQAPNRAVEDAWDAKIRLVQERDALQAEMDSLSTAFTQQEATSILDRYAFVPAAPRPLTYLTANFLHGGWLHLIGNMWFLWLAGFVLEDVWGRVLYTIFYLVAGAAALQFYLWTNPGSIVPTLGASGAVAALMGAFLVRFPKLKIEMGWLLRFRLYRFKMAAYWLLPLWLLMEIFYGTVFGQSSGVAHWAHVGGFLFGAVVATALRFSGMEHKLNQAIEQKVTLEADPDIARASELMDKNQFDAAAQLLNSHLVSHPSSVDAAMLLQAVAMRKGDMPGLQAAVIRCINLHLKARSLDLAWRDFEEFHQAGGDSSRLPVGDWFEIVRYAENQGWNETALTEYQKLAQTYPKERQSLQAQLGAARICLKKLNRPQDALTWFQAAHDSPIPHLDWEQAIASGIREAKAAIAGPKAASASAGK